MNHGLKVNGNILEITLPEEVHIDRVMVNRQMFSQRQRVCESCKYHGLEGHEEPCVSCEVGNSNYVPSVELEERTETHACDCVSRQDAINTPIKMVSEGLEWVPVYHLKELPSAEPEQQWIPCSERMPNKEVKSYWVCTEFGGQCQCRWTNDMYGLGGDDSWGWHVMDKPQYSRIIAWMPLPEPYMEDDE